MLTAYSKPYFSTYHNACFFRSCSKSDRLLYWFLLQFVLAEMLSRRGRSSVLVSTFVCLKFCKVFRKTCLESDAYFCGQGLDLLSGFCKPWVDFLVLGILSSQQLQLCQTVGVKISKV